MIRSKNAGPMNVTIDVIFKDESVYQNLKESKYFTKELVSKTYGIPVTEIQDVVYFPAGRAVKITIRRPYPSGAVEDTDVLGAQMHVPLMSLAIPVSEKRYNT